MSQNGIKGNAFFFGGDGDGGELEGWGVGGEGRREEYED